MGKDVKGKNVVVETSSSSEDVPEDKLVDMTSMVLKPAEATDPSYFLSTEASDQSTSSSTAIDRHAVRARLKTEKRISFIRTWEECEKVKFENKAAKKLSVISAWENAKTAALEAYQKKTEEKLEKQKAKYTKKLKNKLATLKKEAKEKIAIAEADYGEEILNIDEMVAKFRATGHEPKH